MNIIVQIPHTGISSLARGKAHERLGKPCAQLAGRLSDRALESKVRMVSDGMALVLLPQASGRGPAKLLFLIASTRSSGNAPALPQASGRPPARNTRALFALLTQINMTRDRPHPGGACTGREESKPMRRLLLAAAFT